LLFASSALRADFALLYLCLFHDYIVSYRALFVRFLFFAQLKSLSVCDTIALWMIMRFADWRDKYMSKFAVTIATLESHNHIVGDTLRGVKIYERDGVDFTEQEPGRFLAKVPHKGKNFKTAMVTFTRDGRDIDEHHCDCSWRSDGKPLCRHVVALVLAVQGGVVDSKITIGKTAAVSAKVDESNTALAVGSGNLPVFATPMMIALMEKAACAVLSDALSDGETSVGTMINAAHLAASPIGATITATATITAVFGRKIIFQVTASDNKGEIGNGTHERFVVDSERFLERAEKRMNNIH
jgi:predicted thioesterase